MLPIPSTISKVSTLADQTVRITVDCQEMSAETLAEIFSHRGGYGFFHFTERPKEIEEKDIPEVNLEKWEKSPSARLRAVLYRLWEQVKTDLDFEVWYRSNMDNLIEGIKEKLN